MTNSEWSKICLAEQEKQINRARQDRLDAERYRKLKAYCDKCGDWEWSDLWERDNFDAAVDALEVK